MRNDCKHIALEKIRNTLNLLRKSNLGSNPLQREDSLLNRLKALQHNLRHDERDVVDPFEVVAPFLALLRAPYLAGPFKLVALDALQTFTSCNLFSEVPDHGGETLARVVDAVTRCKYVQTDAAGDELVQLQIIHTLSNIIKSPVSGYLTDTTAWDIISASHSILTHIAITGSIKSIVYQAAEKIIIDASRFVFASAGKPIVWKSVEIDQGIGSESSPSGYITGPPPSCVCAVKVLGFFVGILQRHCAEGKAAGMATSSNGTKSPKSSNTQNSGGTTIARHSMALGDQAISPATRELLFTLKAINAIFLAEGDLDASRALISNHEPLASLVRDDLGRCLILLSSRRDFPPMVLQSLLGVFSLTVQLMGPSARILVECFMRFIYIKAVLQIRVIFASHDQSMRMMLESSQSGSSSSKETGLNSAQSQLSSSSSGAGFTIEELEIILESLADLLADLGFIPSLFASFDCDLTKGDVVQPLVKYLGACMRYTLVSEPSELALGGIQEIGALIEQCYGQLSITLNKRGRLRAADTADSNPIPEDDQISENREDICANKSSGTENLSNWVNLSQRLKLTRLAKGVLAEAALKFSNKPQDGLKYLQSRGALPTPLTPASVAKFLRIAPGLPKESTGSFLGELGKDNPKYEADGKIFHREVLLAYVQSFELKGQTVLNCMRIFLSAFRLPGEAQQIDRILVAFSEYCHDGSIEGNNGLLENPEVTYLLTFSMIMLNTDLHNPNVRADRKMTPDQFVKNNSFYGAELNQTRPIPREYLDTIYVSLSQVPLRTERNDLNASITPEMWMDLQLQASIDIEKGFMFSTSYSPTMLRKITKKCDDLSLLVGDEICSTIDLHDQINNGVPVISDVEIGAQNRIDEPDSSSSNIGNGYQNDGNDIEEKNDKNIDPIIDDVAKVASQLLNPPSSSAQREDTVLEMSATFHGLHWIVDSDLLSCVFQDMYGVAISPFVMHRFVVAPTSASVAPQATSMSNEHGRASDISTTDGRGADTGHWRTRHAGVRSLGVGIELSLELLALLNASHMQSAVNSMIILLADFSGIRIQGKFVSTVLNALSLTDFEPTDVEPISALGPKMVAERLKIVSYKNLRQGSRDEGDEKAIVTALESSQSSDEMMEGLLTSIAARAALGTLMLVVHCHPSYLDSQSWQVTWILLSLLRDCTLLPAQMVLSEEGSGDSDLLPPACRAEFESRLVAAERREMEGHTRLTSRTSAEEVKKSSSIMSLQGLGEALFGSSQIDQSSIHPTHNVPPSMPSRWDVGYEGMERTQISLESPSNDSKKSPTRGRAHSSVAFAISNGNSSDIILRGEKSIDGTSEYEDEEAVLAAFVCLREMVASCGIAQLVSDTRFLDEDTMRIFFKSLITTSQSADGFLHLMNPSDNSSNTGHENVSTGRTYGSLIEDNLDVVVLTVSEPLLSAYSRVGVSASSVSWLENILVEASLRNRDRLSLLWDSLSMHYEMTIQNAAILTYSLERRVTAVFTLSARIINRDVFTAPILESFRLFIQSGKDLKNDGNDDIEVDSGLKASPCPLYGALNSNLLLDVAGQISAGMWRVLTTNLDILPTLTLTQWQIIFDVIAVSASAGGYASIKAFESMAWLLHESRLQGEIPMFCIVGIRPLLCNSKAPISVSVGAIKLLSHLHSRLEVLFTNEDDYVQVGVQESDLSPILGINDQDHDQDSDTPVLWESCWTPILAAMAEGCADTRKPVRLAAANALSRAILDKHVRNVPIGLMVKILGDIYIAIILQLSVFLVKEREVNVAVGRQQHETDADVELVGDVISHNRELSAESGEGLLQLLSKDIQKDSLTVMPIMATLCRIFIEQIKRLSSYPSFDRLWLRLVHVFGYFLGAPHGFDHKVSTNRKLDDEMQCTIEAAGGHLCELTNLLYQAGIFKERSGLW
eukprot:CAMPEP_0119047238 /NCGR_PEP_ID=MMETSP1177-20130426/51980_1 /TAXON_ID=2985 /ORGANISM="Ochromonas sp, Strain CCMP1899" /LENGTH=1905 /DNA_ID=CAMNT_0007021581 /DNA_START=110 /DNA_END=5824 /DNA_ORIENTATION=-